MSNKKNIFKWNHISEDLPPDEITKLQNLYKHYHRLFQCYHWKYKKLRRLKLSLQLSSISLTVIGTITGSVTLNPVEGKCRFWDITTHFGPLFKLALNLTEKMKKINKK